jgi:hypothetical protein
MATKSTKDVIADRKNIPAALLIAYYTVVQRLAVASTKLAALSAQSL